MIRTILRSAALLMSAAPGLAMAQQAPWNAKDMPVSHRDRVYASEQFSNTVSVTDPADNRLLGVIKLGDPQPMNFSPLYKGQVLVHGLGFSPDGKTLAVVSIGSNAVSWIDTATNTVKHTTYVGRSPHEAFFTPDGKEVWVTVRGEDYIAVLDPTTYKETGRIKTPGGPGMTIFSPDGRYGYVCSSFNPVLAVFDVATHAQVGQVAQPSPFCPNIAATPDGKQVWFTLKDVGRTQVFSARPPFAPLKTIETGPITNHVNIVSTKAGQFAYVTIGGLNQLKVFRTDDFSQVATIATGALPHGLWPSGDGSRVYVGLENADMAAVIDTASNTVIAEVPIGQGPQGVAYVPNAVPEGDGKQNLQPLGAAGKTSALTLTGSDDKPATQVTLFDQGVLQTLQAAVTGLPAKMPFVLALAANPKGATGLEPLAAFMTNPAGAAIVNAIGPIRQVTRTDAGASRRYLVVVSGKPGELGSVVQMQTVD